MIDERYQTGGALTIIGTVGTWIIDNPTDFVTMSVAVGGFIIMLVKFLEERKQRNEAHKLFIKKAQLEIEQLKKKDE